MAKLTAAQIAGYAKQAGFPPDQIATAVAVAMAESGGDPNAVNRNNNGSTDYGLWQINTIHGSLLNQGNKFDPAANAKMALTVYQKAGNKWTPWTVYKTQSYRTFLPEATLAAARPTGATGVPLGVGGATAGGTAGIAGLPEGLAGALAGVEGGAAGTPGGIGGAEGSGTGTAQPSAEASALQSLLGPLADIASGVTFFMDLLKSIQNVFTAAFWIRLGAGILGAFLVVLGGLGLAGISPTTIVKTVVTKAPGV
jgi:hypothetical protein